MTQKDSELFDSSKGWNAVDASIAEQIALLNIAQLYLCITEDDKATSNIGLGKAAGSVLDMRDPEGAFLEALMATRNMSLSSVTTILSSLRRILLSQNRTLEAGQVLALAEANGFHIEDSSSDKGKGGRGGGGMKRIAFAIDYSGSMSGSKIRSAVSNTLSVFEEHIHFGDHVMLVHFTHETFTDFQLTEKNAETEKMMKNKIQSLSSPGGATAFFDAVWDCMDGLDKNPSSNDWIVAVTDGADGNSRKTVSQLQSRLSSSSVGLIIIGIGSDVETATLEGLTKSTSKGIYVYAEGSKSSIDAAFANVANIITGQVLIEDV